MKKVYEEFVQFDGRFQEGKTSLYGENSPLSEQELKVFFKNYVEYAKSRYGKDVCFQKAVAQSDIDIAEKRLALKEGTTFYAYRRKRKQVYEGWELYTHRAIQTEDYIQFNDDYKFPLPAAKYTLPKGIKEITFAVYIDERYFVKHKGIGPTTTSRFVEFRQGCKEGIKLCFAPNGIFAHKDGSTKPYHYMVTEIGKYEFNQWNIVKIVFEKDKFLLEFNGDCFHLNYSNKVNFDNLYLGGGMQPAKFWRFKPISLVTNTGEISKFFQSVSKKEDEEEYIGECTLPMVLGTKNNQDRELVLRKKFHCFNDGEYRLRIGALDPAGQVYINGNLVEEREDFQPFLIDLTPHVHIGENILEIVVYPRAPETLYPWHRHDDYYNGWFCLSAEIENSKRFGISNLTVKTLKTGKNTNFLLTATVENDALKGKRYALFLKKCCPQEGTSILLHSDILTGDLQKEFCLELDLWNVDSPNLYSVRMEVYEESECCCSQECEVGFRTIEQKDGSVYVNGKKVILKGALNMQFLPPYEEIPLNHVCPSNRQIIEMVLAIKAMNGNTMRLHQLGYGCGDRRFASICDRLGIYLIWPTRMIDSIENIKWSNIWKQAKDYQMQMREVINNPSVIMWEGSNECHGSLSEIDCLYDEFVATVKEIDESRLICPCSHLYYGGGLYSGGHYYSDEGNFDEEGNRVESSFAWKDKDVVRSAHTYCLLLGYGSPWERMVKQDWRWQKELFENEKKAYIVSEYAVIGRQNPLTVEAKEFINKNSYELPDEKDALGYNFSDEEWELSQAYQAICASVATKQLVRNGADGMFWCCLQSGANNASYLKPILDFYGYTKLAYYSLREGFQDALAFNMHPDVLLYKGYEIQPCLHGIEEGKFVDLTVTVLDQEGTIIEKKEYLHIQSSTVLSPFKPLLTENGYYILRYEIEE